MVDFIGPNINLCSSSKTKSSALKELCYMLYVNGCISDKKKFCEAVYRRERVGVTGMENGIAIPHGESDAALRAAIGVLKTRSIIGDWESLDNKPIKLVFLLVVPTKNRNIEHLKLLSHLAAALTHSDIQDRLLKEDSVESFKKIFYKSWECEK
ncbi:PTS sugar transporter subunit IIA [Alkalibaculum bacchi]|jgi:PTS system fructose-specific IIA component|uniref:PTS sugar transporter subunit IIA n=1 Tax=Alkalibaculum bacchi TaxID=645887 RepID=UPI0026EC3ED0|nr:fructose PTS transporter subunit IIA [Alkalibaculum bacchi]